MTALCRAGYGQVATADSRYQLKGRQRDSIVGRIRAPSKASVGAGRLWRLSYHTVSEVVPDLKKVLMGILGAGAILFLLLVAVGFIIDAFDGDDEETDETIVVTGLGVSRDAVEDAFSSFDFEDAPLNDGRERLLGEALDGALTLQLIGEDSNLEEAALIMTVNAGANDSIPGYASLFLSTVLPGWAGGADWFEQGVIELADDSRQNAEIETMHGNARIQLTANKQFGWLTLAIDPAQENTAVTALSSNTGNEATPVVLATISPTATVEVAQAPQRIRRSPVPTPTEGTWEQERLGPRTLLVGALGNGGIVAGKYEYQDATGDKIVWGDSCVLKLNQSTPQQENIKLEKGLPFTFYIQDKHRHVFLEGKDGGCTGDSSVGYALLRVGGLGD